MDQVSVQRIQTLYPTLRQEATEVLEKAWSLGIRLRYSYTLRTFAEQDLLYAQGRTRPGKKVTWAMGGQSYHNYGLALDICLLSADGKMALWDTKTDYNGDKKADWMQVVDLFKAKGWEWGGDWKGGKVDMPHFQKSFGQSITSLRRAYNARGNKPY